MKFNRVIGIVVKYITLTGCGILLYILAAKYAFAKRGYFAVGGEGLLVFLPVFYGLTKAVVQDAIKDIKARDRNDKGVEKR